MPRAALLVALAAAWPLGAAGSRGRASPVQQAIQMLTGMKAKAELATSEEQKVFATYEEWVDDRSKELDYEIQTSKSSIQKLTAFIDKADNKVASLGKAISNLEGDISRLEGEKKDATAVRKSEKDQYLKVQKDYAESVDALERAIETVESEAYDRPQAANLLQQMAKTTPGMGRVYVAFLQSGQVGVGAPAPAAMMSPEASAYDSLGAPSAAAYGFQSGGIVSFLEDLLTKFKGELDKTEEAESNSAHYYELQMVHLSDTIAQSKADLQERSTAKTEAAAASAKAKGELADAKKELAGDEAFLKDITATYHAKQTVFAGNQQVRKDESAALSKALEILSSPDVADSYGQHLGLAQAAVPQEASFLQTASTQRRQAARRRAEDLLRQRAGEISSRTLQSLLAQMATNPFSKVITMIEDLLARLKQEASAEADHKAWCDQQLKSNKLKREKKSTKVKELDAQLDDLAIKIEDAGKAVERLVQEQADLAKSMKEATAQREKEKKANADAIADAKAGADGVKRALVVLKEFYSSQSASASLLQQGAGQVPEMAAYTGMQGRNTGVIGMLEVIQSDFARLQAETEVAEKQAVAQYDQFMDDATADKKLKHDEEVKLRLQKDADEFKAKEKKKDMALNQQALDTANKYFDELKPSCLEVHVSFGAREKRRKEEIAALKEAYGILGSKASP